MPSAQALASVVCRVPVIDSVTSQTCDAFYRGPAPRARKAHDLETKVAHGQISDYQRWGPALLCWGPRKKFLHVPEPQCPHLVMGEKPQSHQGKKVLCKGISALEMPLSFMSAPGEGPHLGK
jgi:hypothetical protein